MQVLLHGGLRDEEALGYLRVGQPFCDQVQDFPLASGEEVDPLVRPTFFIPH